MCFGLGSALTRPGACSSTRALHDRDLRVDCPEHEPAPLCHQGRPSPRGRSAHREHRDDDEEDDDADYQQRCGQRRMRHATTDQGV
jgi:hypothetical protein